MCNLGVSGSALESESGARESHRSKFPSGYWETCICDKSTPLLSVVGTGPPPTTRTEPQCTLLSLLSAAILDLPTPDLETLNLEISHAYIEAWSRVVSTTNARKFPLTLEHALPKGIISGMRSEYSTVFGGLVVMWSTRDRGKLEGRCDELVKGDEPPCEIFVFISLVSISWGAGLGVSPTSSRGLVTTTEGAMYRS